MKKFILLFVIVFLPLGESVPQWSNDPNNNLIIGYGWDPLIVSDSAGGCYVTYNYESFYPQKLAVERLDKYGYKPWGDKKQILGELPEQWQAEIVEDGEGGVIVSYEDNEVNGTDYITRVRVQRVGSNGNFLWGQTGVRVTVEETNHGGQRLVNDGDGGCVVVWPKILQNFYYEYRANRINNLGERTWGDTGIFLENNINSDPARIVRASDGSYYVGIRESTYRIRKNGEIVRKDSTTLVVIAPDPEGGIVLTGITGNINNRILVTQRQDSLGSNLWQEPYVEIADSLYMNTVLMIQKNNGYFYYGWSGKKNGVDRIAQYQALRLDGSKLFSQGSISISNRSPLAISGIFPSDSNKMIFIWGNSASLPDTTLAQMYDTLGNKLWNGDGVWNEDGIVVAHPSIGHQTYAPDGNGGFIIGGTIDQFTIVAQQVNKYGKLGEILTDVYLEGNNETPTETVLFQNYPNPFNSSTVIRFQLLKESEINIDIYNVLGEKIKTIVGGFYSRGMHSFNFLSNELSSGIYLYKMTTGTQSLTKKLIIIK